MKAEMSRQWNGAYQQRRRHHQRQVRQFDEFFAASCERRLVRESLDYRANAQPSSPTFHQHRVRTSGCGRANMRSKVTVRAAFGVGRTEPSARYDLTQTSPVIERKCHWSVT